MIILSKLWESEELNPPVTELLNSYQALHCIRNQRVFDLIRLVKCLQYPLR